MKQQFSRSLLFVLATLFLSVPALAADKEKKTKAQFFGGVFYGHVTFIQPDDISIYVQPIDEKMARQRFYLDKKTKVDRAGKRVKLEKLLEGHKVAIRYFAKGRFAMADEIFIVDGEFNPPLYSAKRRRKKK